jgi:hypothetical protein
MQNTGLPDFMLPAASQYLDLCKVGAYSLSDDVKAIIHDLVQPFLDHGTAKFLCDAVLLQADGLQPVVIVWNGVSAIQFSGAERFGDNANDAHGLILERAGDRLFIKGSSLLRVLPAGFDLTPTDCPNGER